MLLVQCQSYRLEIIMCIMTVFSISLLCYVVSDLDYPFTGLFKVDLSVLPDVIHRVRQMYDHAKNNRNKLCNYPERGWK